MNPVKIRKIIAEKIPEGSVVTAHTDKGHFYHVPHLDKTFPSVTGKLQPLKDPGLTNYKMNRAIDYVYEHHKEFTSENIMEHLEKAAQVSVDVFEDAGNVGTEIHEYREKFFNAWIATGGKPESSLLFIPAYAKDTRIISAMRGLDKFVAENDYRPIKTEQLVYSERFEIGGTLDDIGIMKWKGKYVLALIDVKTSNQFKNHYFFQVAMYYMMFVTLTGLKPDLNIILKLSKTDGTYKIEEMKYMNRLVSYSKAVLRTNDGLEFIKGLRKDNRKKVATI